jgi:hypothetical protein
MAPAWRTAAPADVIAFAEKQGLDAIAITDHNTVDWCDAIRTAAKGSSLTVFPGVEISTKHGHLLAIFDPDFPADRIRELLVQCGITSEKNGDLNAASSDDMDVIARRIEAAGGLAIAAHVESTSRGLMKFGVHAECLRVAREPTIRGFEVPDRTRRDHYLGAKVAGLDRRIGCVMSSDSCAPAGGSHALDAVGNRYSMIKLEHFSVQSLKQALLDPEMRIKLSGDPVESPTSVVEALWIQGGFLHGQLFRFSTDLTCLIGATGSGKSFTLELLRFALEQQAAIPKIANEVASLLRKCLGNRATVYVLVSRDGAQYLIQRVFEPSVAYSATVARLVPAGLEEIITDTPTFFPIKAYSQSEIIEFARVPTTRLSLTDDLIDIAQERAEIARIKEELRLNAIALIQKQQAASNAESSIAELATVQTEIARLAAVINNPRVEGHKNWLAERKTLSTLQQQLADLHSRARSSFPAGPTVELESAMPNVDLLAQAQRVAESVQADFTSAQTSVLTAIEAASASVASIAAAWQLRFDAELTDYERILRTADATNPGVHVLGRKLTDLVNQERELLQTQRQLDLSLRPELDRCVADREAALTRLQGHRRSITTKRSTKAAELTRTLGRRVVLEVDADADNQTFFEGLQRLRTGSRLSDADLREMAEHLHPVPFVKSLVAGNYDSLTALVPTVEASKFERFASNIAERNLVPDLYELQTVDTDDIIHIRFAMVDGSYRALEHLAHGQKCTVVLMIAMAEGSSPLMVDQPEDALHPPYIEENIVATIREQRGRRQYIFATRNANILVSGDAEQVIVIDADANAGAIQQTGCVDGLDTRDPVVHHLEGGRDAFSRKTAKYGVEG